MKIKETPISELLILEPKVFNDDRGSFFESYNQDRYKEAGITSDFLQDNISYSHKNTIRGLHYQLAPYGQSKLVQVLKGKVLDVIVDLRKDSSTFGKHFSIELSDENRLQLLIPRGFAHGFSVLSESAIFHYKCDNLYHHLSERGIKFNDRFLNIDWKIEMGKRIVSSKDEALPNFNEAEMNF